MKAGEIYLAMFPLGDAPGGMKLRPVLLLSGAVGPVPEVLVAYISSVIPVTALPTDILLDPARPEHRATNLKVPSVLRLHKLATIHTRSSARSSGVMPRPVAIEVTQKLRAFLGL